MDSTLISRRREEVTQEVTRLQKRLADMERELVELDTAERVIARLSGAERPSVGSGDAGQSQEASGGKPEGIPTTPEMIIEALTEWNILGDMEPKDVRDWIKNRYWPGVQSESVTPIMWRMEQRGQLTKEGSRYRLSRTNETPDENPAKDTSEASNTQPPAQGREAGPGGGT